MAHFQGQQLGQETTRVDEYGNPVTAGHGITGTRCGADWWVRHHRHGCPQRWASWVRRYYRNRQLRRRGLRQAGRVRRHRNGHPRCRGLWRYPSASRVRRHRHRDPRRRWFRQGAHGWLRGHWHRDPWHGTRRVRHHRHWCPRRGRFRHGAHGGVRCHRHRDPWHGARRVWHHRHRNPRRRAVPARQGGAQDRRHPPPLRQLQLQLVI